MARDVAQAGSVDFAVDTRSVPLRFYTESQSPETFEEFLSHRQSALYVRVNNGPGLRR